MTASRIRIGGVFTKSCMALPNIHSNEGGFQCISLIDAYEFIGTLQIYG